MYKIVEILKEKVLMGYREKKILQKLDRVEKIRDYEPYEAFRVYGNRDYFEVVKIGKDYFIVG